MTSGPKGRLYQCKGNGMVRDVFEESQLAGLVGSLGIGHGNLFLFHPLLKCSTTKQPQFVSL